MSDAQDVNPEKRRRTVTLTHRQVGATGITALLVALAPYLKETFVTREDAAKQADRLERLEQAYTAKTIELSAKIDDSTKTVVDRIREAEERTTKNADRVERRVDRLEVAIFSKIKNNEN